MDSVPTSNGSICQLKHTALNIAKCLCHILCNTHQLELHVGNTLVILWKMQKLNMEIKTKYYLFPNTNRWRPLLMCIVLFCVNTFDTPNLAEAASLLSSVDRDSNQFVIDYSPIWWTRLFKQGAMLIYPNPDKWDDHHRVQHSCYFLWAVQGAFNDITPNVEWVE